uniref:Uncharacterized protein n=1 Tax=Ditylenchus dipsaci TaxID=166011 RepID=A0A915DLG0_9BILA
MSDFYWASFRSFKKSLEGRPSIETRLYGIFLEFVPLIAWFYLSIIIIISIGTFLLVYLSIQGRRQYGKVPPLIIRYIFFVKIVNFLCLLVPPQLFMIWEEMDDHPSITYKTYFSKLKKRRFGSRKRADQLEKEEAEDPAFNNRGQLTHQDSQFDDRFLAPPTTFGPSPVSLNFSLPDSILRKSRASSVTLEERTPTEEEPSRARFNWQRVGQAAAAVASDIRLNEDYSRIQQQAEQQSRREGAEGLPL